MGLLELALYVIGDKMIVFRAMSIEEASKVTINNPLSWKSKFKWFGTEDFVQTRVLDGKFNNSKYKNKYQVLCKYEIVSGVEHFLNVVIESLCCLSEKQTMLILNYLVKRI